VKKFLTATDAKGRKGKPSATKDTQKHEGFASCPW
jgi:hypothetical protein